LKEPQEGNQTHAIDLLGGWWISDFLRKGRERFLASPYMFDFSKLSNLAR
jgi:hypothetical protein